MDADPNTGVYVLDSFDGGYLQVGGTSLATPMWGGLIAIANQGRSLMGDSSLNGLTQTLPTLYDLPSTDFHDITTGSNGTYSATPGYDLVTGLGTPVANLLVPALAGYPSTQPPSVSGPSAISVNENSTLLFAPSQSDLITLADSQAGSNADTLTLSVSDGTLALGSTSGLTSISGNGSATVTHQRHAGQPECGHRRAGLHTHYGLQRLRSAQYFAQRSGRQPHGFGDRGDYGQPDQPAERSRHRRTSM